ncbi:unnamed protein product, partial [Rotaria sp. Silwood1]
SITGSASNQLHTPYYLTSNSRDSVYIGDSDNHRVQKYLKGPSSVTQRAGSNELNYSNKDYATCIYSGSSASSNNRLDHPYGIACDSNTGTLYMADTNNNRIISYASDTSFGSVVAQGNGEGAGSTQLSDPRGICFDSSSNSLVIAN